MEIDQVFFFFFFFCSFLLFLFLSLLLFLFSYIYSMFSFIPCLAIAKEGHNNGPASLVMHAALLTTYIYTPNLISQS